MARIGRMTNSITAIKPERLAQYAKDFNADRANLVAANAAVSSGVLEAATDYKGQRALPRDFSIELKQGSITNQRRSGRCWMFASLNTLRYELMHQWGLDDFEFSETYLFFWDAMEKSNTYLENVFATLDEPTDSRLFQEINYGPADDGGWWQMFAALVDKYGLVPKSAYPESANSKDSDAFKQYLNSSCASSPPTCANVTQPAPRSMNCARSRTTTCPPCTACAPSRWASRRRSSTSWPA